MLSIENNTIIPILLSSIIGIYLLRLLFKRPSKDIDPLRFFHGHVGDELLNRIKNHNQKITFSGEEKLITVMFVDIRGFTKMSESFSNKKVFKVLNEYLGKISEIIVENNGMIDKYLGDGVMAIWGAPIYSKHQASESLKAAYEIKKAFDTEAVKVGIGINTGPAMLGNVGRENIKSYTAIGDTVNLSARVESLNKLYGSSILFTENTKKKLLTESKFASKGAIYREIDKVKVYGRNSTTKIFELIKFGQGINRNEHAGYEWFKMAVTKYRKGMWIDAESFFRQSLRYLSNDEASKLYIKRCQEFSKLPPSKWDGTISLSKL